MGLLSPDELRTLIERCSSVDVYCSGEMMALLREVDCSIGGQPSLLKRIRFEQSDALGNAAFVGVTQVGREFVRDFREIMEANNE